MVQIRADDLSPEAIGPKVVAALNQLQTELLLGALVTIDPARTRLPLAADPNALIALNLSEFDEAPNIDAGEGVKMMFAEMAASGAVPATHNPAIRAALATPGQEYLEIEGANHCYLGQPAQLQTCIDAVIGWSRRKVVSIHPPKTGQITCYKPDN